MPRGTLDAGPGLFDSRMGHLFHPTPIKKRIQRKKGSEKIPGVMGATMPAFIVYESAHFDTDKQVKSFMKRKRAELMQGGESWAVTDNLGVVHCEHCGAELMKKGPMHIYERATKRHPITGTTAAESLIRTQSWIGRGCNSYSIQKGRAAKSNPLAPWLEQDILHYIKRNDIEICSVYGDLVYTDADGNELDTALDADQPLKCTGCQRTGCMFCPFGVHLEKGPTRYQRMKITHPRQYEFMLGGGEWTTEGGARYGKRTNAASGLLGFST